MRKFLSSPARAAALALSLMLVITQSGCVGVIQTVNTPAPPAVSTPDVSSANTPGAGEASTVAPLASPIVIAPASPGAATQETGAPIETLEPGSLTSVPAIDVTPEITGTGGPVPSDQMALLVGGPPVAIVPAGGGEPRPVGAENLATYGSLYFRFSPDRRSIVYTGGADLWLLDVTTGQSRQLTSDDRWHLMPAWSPDGQLIAEVSRPLLPDETKDGWMTGDWGGALAVLRPDASEFRVLDQAGLVVSPPSWAPDGHRVAYAADGKLRVYDIESDQRQELDPMTFGLKAAYVDGPSWSPDGRHLAVHIASGPPPSPDDLAGGKASDVEQSIAVIDLTARTSATLMTWTGIAGGEPPTLRWQPAGTLLLIDIRPGPSSSQQPRLWLADPASTNRQDLGLAAYDAAWSPDGQRIAAIDLDDRQRLEVFEVGPGLIVSEPMIRRWDVPLEGLDW